MSSTDETDENGVIYRHLEDQSDLLDYPDEELRRIFVYNIGGHRASDRDDKIAKLCFYILQLRRQEDLVRQTEELVRKTWWLTIATRALAVVILPQF
jgi:hypothetical protein